MVCICEPETGENLGNEEKRSSKYLVDYQEGNHEFSIFQVSNEMRSVEDLMNFQEGRIEIPIF